MGMIGRAVRRFGMPILVDAAGLVGAALIAYGTWLVYEPAGFIVGGCLLLVGAWLSARTPAE